MEVTKKIFTKKLLDKAKNILIYTTITIFVLRAINWNIKGYSGSEIRYDDTILKNENLDLQEPQKNTVDLYVNDVFIATFEENDLNLILEEMKNQSSHDGASQAEFVEKIRIEKSKNLPEKYENLKKKILFGEQKEIEYEVVKQNENISDIAEKFDITEEEIFTINNLKNCDLSPGQKIKIQYIKKILNINSYKIVTENIEIPFETETFLDKNLELNTKKIVEEGITGEKNLTKKIYYLNGIEQKTEILNTEIIKKPINQKINLGTKKIFTKNDILKNLTWPVNYTKKISSGFGKRGKQTHHGIDISEKGIENQPICTVADGVVEFAGTDASGYGTHVIVDHGCGIKTLYAHCKNNLSVKKGDKVTQNQILGKVGSTGDSSGYHLHLELIIDGIQKNFLDYFNNQQ